MKDIAVKQLEGAEIATEVLASAIVSISAGVKRLRAGKLNDKALHLLIQHASPTQGVSGLRIPISTIKDVLDGLSSLEAAYIRKPGAATKGGRGS
jgi:hypothetical protein